MTYVYAALVVGTLSAIFIFSYKLNNKVKIDCDTKDMCEGCKVLNCFKRKNKEE